jgi:hypothetical protein
MDDISPVYDMASSTIGSIGDTTTVALANVATNVRAKLPTIMASSLSLIAGLAWNSFFNSLITYYVPEEYRQSYSAWIKVAYAFILTIIIIAVIGIIFYYLPPAPQIINVAKPSYTIIDVK